MQTSGKGEKLMNYKRFTLALACATLVSALAGLNVQAQCPTSVLASGLKAPVKIILAQKVELLVAESGNGPNTGRISVITLPDGHRRTLLDGLPSGFSAPNNDPSGPSGLAMRGRTLFVSIGLGDAVINGAIPGTQVPNPNPSSPILSSVLAIRFRERGELPDDGATLTLADHFALKNGAEITLGHGEARMTIRLVGDFPDYTPEPRPGEPNNVRQSNPFGLVVVDDQLDVVDASTNQVRTMEIDTGAIGTLTSFGTLPNTRGFGPPFVEAVPDSIHLFEDQLLVTLLSGFPFPVGGAQVRTVDPSAGTDAPFITGLTSAIDVLPVRVSRSATAFLTLEFSADMLGPLPGRLRYFSSPTATPSVVADCLITPTSMARDGRTGKVYVTEISTGRVMKVSQ
jgi:hypothetical protein